MTPDVGAIERKADTLKVGRRAVFSACRDLESAITKLAEAARLTGLGDASLDRLRALHCEIHYLHGEVETVIGIAQAGRRRLEAERRFTTPPHAPSSGAAPFLSWTPVQMSASPRSPTWHGQASRSFIVNPKE